MRDDGRPKWLVPMVSSNPSAVYCRLTSLKLSARPALLTITCSFLPVAWNSPTNLRTDSRDDRSNYKQASAVAEGPRDARCHGERVANKCGRSRSDQLATAGLSWQRLRRSTCSGEKTNRKIGEVLSLR